MDKSLCGMDQFLSALHFVVACEFLKYAIVDVNSPKITQRIFTNFTNLLKSTNVNEFRNRKSRILVLWH